MKTAILSIILLWAAVDTGINAQPTSMQAEKGIGIPNRWKIEKLMTDTGVLDLTAYNMYAEFNLQKGKVSGQAGCNNFFGEVKTAPSKKGNRFIKMEKFATTRMACPNMQLESTVLLALQQVTNYNINAARLLLKQDNKIKFVLRKIPTEAVGDSSASNEEIRLAGSYKFISMKTDSATIKLDSIQATISLNPKESKVTGNAPCNGFGGSMSAQPTTTGKGAIKLEKFITTMMACDNLETEKQLLRLLELVDNYEILDNRLLLKKDTDTIFELQQSAEEKKL